ncbi:MAG: hypothetical protein M1817_006332 [Caeruleum heppii]|nr:MAG: hypothetical protein M1817_006332 [Caeruleum heppii]
MFASVRYLALWLAAWLTLCSFLVNARAVQQQAELDVPNLTFYEQDQLDASAPGSRLVKRRLPRLPPITSMDEYCHPTYGCVITPVEIVFTRRHTTEEAQSIDFVSSKMHGALMMTNVKAHAEMQSQLQDRPAYSDWQPADTAPDGFRGKITLNTDMADDIRISWDLVAHVTGLLKVFIEEPYWQFDGQVDVQIIRPGMDQAIAFMSFWRIRNNEPSAFFDIVSAAITFFGYNFGVAKGVNTQRFPEL